MIEEIDWHSVRAEFPITSRAAYLKSAATAPPAPGVAETVAQFYREMTEGGDAHWEAWARRRERARESLARFINAEPDEVAFVPNTSTGMNIIIDALEGSGEVISCELEFPTSTLPWIHRGIAVKTLPARDGIIEADDIERAMNGRTGIVCLSHVQFSNGFRVDLETVGAAKGRHAFVVNAAQSVGVLPIDVRRMKIDAMCATGHKWLLGGFGSGFLYMSREMQRRHPPLRIGWMSVEEPFAFRNREYTLIETAGARAEIGTAALPAMHALGTSIEFLTQLGKDEIERRALEVNRYLTTRLIEQNFRVLSPLRDERARSAETLVAFDNPANTVAHLAARDVHVSLKPEGIRIATHFFNDETDVERLIRAVGRT
ncbi:MAG: aminotransferase class V-fold PLP-dependent enzyme [Pyrinomonadaceae bacterium MAG19_C2-C3]|nr:aminotransferase class V-fold PLP-dependent enzyme [Pyrinomonadaceae bacterium MAG19_C2-C3]